MLRADVDSLSCLIEETDGVAELLEDDADADEDADADADADEDELALRWVLMSPVYVCAEALSCPGSSSDVAI